MEKKKFQHQYDVCTIHLRIHYDSRRQCYDSPRWSYECSRMLTMPPRFDTVLVRFKPVALGSIKTSHECTRFSGWHVTVGQIMTPNIIISSTFDETSHAKKKNFSKNQTSPDPPARLSPVPNLVVSDDESTLGQAGRDPPAKDGQTDLTRLTVSQPVQLLCSLVRHFCPVQVAN